jgi:hypothetical protein
MRRKKGVSNMTIEIGNLTELNRYQLRQGLAALDATEERKRRERESRAAENNSCLYANPLNGVRCKKPRTHGSRCEEHL